MCLCVLHNIYGKIDKIQFDLRQHLLLKHLERQGGERVKDSSVRVSI